MTRKTMLFQPGRGDSAEYGGGRADQRSKAGFQGSNPSLRARLLAETGLAETLPGFIAKDSSGSALRRGASDRSSLSRPVRRIMLTGKREGKLVMGTPKVLGRLGHERSRLLRAARLSVCDSPFCSAVLPRDGHLRGLPSR